MVEVRRYKASDYRSCVAIATDLHEWFDAKALKEIRNKLNPKSTFVYDNNGIQGFEIIDNNKDELEVAFIAVDLRYHKNGIGTLLLSYLNNEYPDAKRLVVKTLDDSVDYHPYQITRDFYIKNGFRKIKVFDNPNWDPGNTCAVFQKIL